MEADEAESWREVFPDSERAKARLVVSYPSNGWAKWKPLLYSQIQDTLRVFFFLLVVEGCIMEGVESLTAEPEERGEFWFWSTVGGRRKFYEHGTQRPEEKKIVQRDDPRKKSQSHQVQKRESDAGSDERE